MKAHKFGAVDVVRIGKRDEDGRFRWELHFQHGMMAGLENDFEAALLMVRAILGF